MARMTIEEYPEHLQKSYYATLKAIGKSEAWGEVALNLKPKENWYNYNGFGLFRNENYQRQVDAKMEGKKDITVDDLERNLRSLTDYVNQLEERIRILEERA